MQSAVRFVSGETDHARLVRFIVTGSVPTSQQSEPGGGVLVDGATPVLEEVAVRDCSAETGGGIAVLSGGLTLLPCQVLENAATGSGGGILIEQGRMLVLGGEIRSNIADDLGIGGRSGGRGLAAHHKHGRPPVLYIIPDSLHLVSRGGLTLPSSEPPSPLHNPNSGLLITSTSAGGGSSDSPDLSQHKSPAHSPTKLRPHSHLWGLRPSIPLTLLRIITMQPRIMYIESKPGDDLSGLARIGLVSFSKTGATLYYAGKSFRSLRGQGFDANYYDIESDEKYWISGCKKGGGDRLFPGIIEIDDDVRETYWCNIRKLPDRSKEATIRCKGKPQS